MMLVFADMADSEQSASYYYGPSVLITEMKKKKKAETKKKKRRSHSHLHWTPWSSFFLPCNQNAMLPYKSLLRL